MNDGTVGSIRTLFRWHRVLGYSFNIRGITGYVVTTKNSTKTIPFRKVLKRRWDKEFKIIMGACDDR